MSMKKSLILLILGIIIAGGLFAQEARAANVRNNWISGELSFLGAGARYERMLGPKFSVGANVYWNSFFLLWNELEVGISARFYPWGKNFLLGLGLGFHTHSGTFDYESTDPIYGKQTLTWFGEITGAAITPEIGWKIDVGQPGSFFLQPGVKIPITLGSLKGYDESMPNEFRVAYGIVPYFGMGYAF